MALEVEEKIGNKIEKKNSSIIICHLKLVYPFEEYFELQYFHYLRPYLQIKLRQEVFLKIDGIIRACCGNTGLPVYHTSHSNV